MRKNESGRSMVEMLGVLAIIGVLSIGGIAGYTLSMNRYRANEGVDFANKVASLAYADCQVQLTTGDTCTLKTSVADYGLTVPTGWSFTVSDFNASTGVKVTASHGTTGVLDAYKTIANADAQGGKVFKQN
jgi:Tfp pilus assembly protein PilE